MKGRGASRAGHAGPVRPDAEGLERLVAAARAVRAHAYAPYSRYAVGAAILTRSGDVYVGCNFENATFGATICAERSAVGAMVAAGDRHPVACAVATGGPEPGSPCGICRQVLAEFASDMPILLVTEPTGPSGGKRKATTLAELLPMAFRLKKGGKTR